MYSASLAAQEDWAYPVVPRKTFSILMFSNILGTYCSTYNEHEYVWILWMFYCHQQAFEHCSTGDIPPVTGSWLLYTLANCDAYPIMRYFWGRQSWCPCFYPKAFSLQTFLSAKRDTCYCSKGGQPGLVNLLTHKSSLVGGFNPSEKYESQLGWLQYSQYLAKWNSCSKPPTSSSSS